ncbi:39S ribosomal protein L17, mitochondrial-like [Pollicipes pollicipes]|uniref:39S ribosomal protein L17, mitochondrial-like n=1 Tax=Pollicipes pollicipes TaxID=41117 RepID=UPI0018853BFD|nr:39S ribosomal protein L17, mitochondrial-like [Pollicipes pollicipes]XP_037090349.1 39S ribosomal protein L17, mitochondrial-like [Pollicipes pollicipes]
MSQLGRLIPQLRVPVRPTYRKLRNPEGSYGRLKNLRGTVTALVRDERVEMPLDRLDEARGYAERLIQEAVRHGDKDPHVMDMANFWLNEKQLIHKLFKVLAPRYAEYRTSYTSLHRLPPMYRENDKGAPKGVLELKENPFPPLKPDARANRHLLHNVLLDEARKQYRHNKYQQLAAEARADLAAAAAPEPPAGQTAELRDSVASKGASDMAAESPGAEGTAATEPQHR